MTPVDWCGIKSEPILLSFGQTVVIELTSRMQSTFDSDCGENSSFYMWC